MSWPKTAPALSAEQAEQPENYVRELICRILHDIATGGYSLADKIGRAFRVSLS